MSSTFTMNSNTSGSTWKIESLTCPYRANITHCALCVIDGVLLKLVILDGLYLIVYNSVYIQTFHKQSNKKAYTIILMSTLATKSYLSKKTSSSTNYNITFSLFQPILKVYTIITNQHLLSSVITLNNLTDTKLFIYELYT